MEVCNCKKSFITNLFLSTIDDAYEVADNMFIDAPDKVELSVSKTKEVIEILESQCVCKQNYIMIVVDEDLPGEHTIKKCRTCNHEAIAYPNKKIFPCESSPHVTTKGDISMIGTERKNNDPVFKVVKITNE